MYITVVAYVIKQTTELFMCGVSNRKTIQYNRLLQ